jgi:hypothetical protein
MELLILCIEFIIKKLNLGIAVTIDTPAHTKIAYLPNPVHTRNITMTGGTIDLSNLYMLSMAKKDMILEVINLGPLNWNTAFPCFNHFINLVFPGMASFPHNGVTIPANIKIGNTGMLRVGHRRVTVLAIDLVVRSMNHMGKLHRLIGLVVLLSSQGSPCLIKQLGLPAQGHNEDNPQNIASFHLFNLKDVKDHPGEHHPQKNKQKYFIDHRFALRQSVLLKVVKKELY